jgi:electron transfer flavoprotein beta subunit
LKIAVAIKQVPDTEAKIAIAPDGRSIDPSNVTFVVNPYDEYALEQAIRIREAEGAGEVIAVSVGAARASQALRTCLAVGADRAVHIKDDGADALDVLTTARALAAAMKEIAPDLILTGKYAVGTDNQATAVMMAEFLGIPHVSVVTRLDLRDGKLIAEREIEGAIEVHEATTPCVITAQKGLNEPRYASLKGIMAAKKKSIDEKSLADLGITGDAAAPAVTWEKLELPPAKAAGRIIDAQNDPLAAARELVRSLREDARVI